MIIFYVKSVGRTTTIGSTTCAPHVLKRISGAVQLNKAGRLDVIRDVRNESAINSKSATFTEW